MMRIYKKTLSLIVTVILLLNIMTSFAWATTVTLSLTPVKQEKSAWCWAACDVMVGKQAYPSSTRNQWNVVYDVFGNTENQTANLPQTADGAAFVTYDTIGFYSNAWSWSWTSVKDEIITQRQAFITQHQYYDSSGNYIGGHNYAVYGADDVQKTIKFANPTDASTYWMTYDSFRDGGTVLSGYPGEWYGTVFRI